MRVDERIDESHVYIYLSIFTLISLVCRHLLAYIYIPVIQRELDVFRASVWNSHPIRKQKKKELPTGVPDHIYHCPEEYGSEKCGLQVSDNNLREVAEMSNVLNATDDYLDKVFRMECERHIPNTDNVEPAQAAYAYL